MPGESAKLLLPLAALALAGCSMAPPGMMDLPALRRQAGEAEVAALNEAVALAAELRYDEAAERLSSLLPALRASGDRQRLAEAMFWLGYCREKQGRLDLAGAWYDRVTAVCPNTPAAAQAAERRSRLTDPDKLRRPGPVPGGARERKP